MIKINVSNNIKIIGLTDTQATKLKNALTIPNKEFFKFQRMGIWAPRDYKYYKELESALVIPRGCYGRLVAFLNSQKVVYDITEDLVRLPCIQGQSTLVLRDYQRGIVDNIVDKLPSEGTIVSSTGSGKTIMALEIIHRLGLTSTVLCHNTVLAEQFINEAEKFWGIKAARIDATHKEIGLLTVATFQSLMASKELLEKLSNKTSVLFVDEAQGIVSKERRKVLNGFKPKHIFGLTATPERTDSLTPAIFFLLGKPLAEHVMEQAQPTIEVVRTQAKIPMSDSYHRIIDSMVENHSRNVLIAGLATGEALQGRKVLVLTKRIKHYENIKTLLPDFNGIFFVNSDDPDRNALLARFKAGEQHFSIIFGTTALLAVGVDISCLDTLILACDMKSSVLTTQSVGRVMRLFDGKPTPKIIDLWDDQNAILTKQFFERKRLYEKKGWKIT